MIDPLPSPPLPLQHESLSQCGCVVMVCPCEFISVSKRAIQVRTFQARLLDNKEEGKSCSCCDGWCYLKVRLDS